MARKALELSDLLLLGEACCALTIVNLSLRCTSWGRFVRVFQGRDSQSAPAAPRDLYRKIGRAAERGGRWLPWRPLCLERAAAAAIMLRVRQLPAKLSVGVRRDEKFGAHAWLSVEDEILVGRFEQAHFVEIACWEI